MPQLRIPEHEWDARNLEVSVNDLRDQAACIRYLNSVPLSRSRHGHTGRIWARAIEIRNLKIGDRIARQEAGGSTK